MLLVPLFSACASKIQIACSAYAAISALRIGPAALPCASQSAGNILTGMPRSTAQSFPRVSTPAAPPQTTSVIMNPEAATASSMTFGSVIVLLPAIIVCIDDLLPDYKSGKLHFLEAYLYTALLLPHDLVLLVLNHEIQDELDLADQQVVRL